MVFDYSIIFQLNGESTSLFVGYLIRRSQETCYGIVP